MIFENMVWNFDEAVQRAMGTALEQSGLRAAFEAGLRPESPRGFEVVGLDVVMRLRRARPQISGIR